MSSCRATNANGGCRCFKNLESWIEAEQRWNREEVRRVQQDTQRLLGALREARAEVERLKSEAGRCDCDFCEAHGRSGHAKQLLESLRERCAAALNGYDGHYGLSGSAARRIVRAVPLEEP